MKVSFVYTLKTFTITFDDNGGVGGPGTVTKYYKVDATIPDTIPTRDGFIFVGWGTRQSTANIAYRPGELYTKDVSVTLYAVWRSTGDHGEIDEYYKIT